MMFDKHLTIYVKGKQDALIVNKVLQVAHYPLERIKIVALGSKKKIAQAIKGLDNSKDCQRHAVLVDLDAYTVKDAEALAQKQLGHPNIPVFCAVPTVEAWLFADHRVAARYSHSDRGRKLVERLPLPEEIPHPKQLASIVFGRGESMLKVLDEIDINLAASRSPSLRVFLEGVGKLLQLDYIPASEAYSRSMNRDIFSNLISEVVPGDTIIYRTMDGYTFTASEMMRHIREGTELGKQYASDVLRVTRNFLAHKARLESKS